MSFREKIKNKILKDRISSSLPPPSYIKDLENYIYACMFNFAYLPNIPKTRLKITSNIENYLLLLELQGYIRDFKVICDDSNNIDFAVQYNIQVYFTDVLTDKKYMLDVKF